VLLELPDPFSVVGTLSGGSVRISLGLLVPLETLDAFLDKFGDGFTRIRGRAIGGACPGRGSLEPGQDLLQYPALPFLLGLDLPESVIE